jgi:hypothetical protein
MDKRLTKALQVDILEWLEIDENMFLKKIKGHVPEWVFNSVPVTPGTHQAVDVATVGRFYENLGWKWYITARKIGLHPEQRNRRVMMQGPQ